MYQPWCAPNPNNFNDNENCVVMNGDNPGCAGGMWYDVSCGGSKNLAVCRVPGVAPQARRLLAGKEVLEAEHAVFEVSRKVAHQAEIAAVKARLRAA
jgi:hypothetical protein